VHADCAWRRLLRFCAGTTLLIHIRSFPGARSKEQEQGAGSRCSALLHPTPAPSSFQPTRSGLHEQGSTERASTTPSIISFLSLVGTLYNILVAIVHSLQVPSTVSAIAWVAITYSLRLTAIACDSPSAVNSSVSSQLTARSFVIPYLQLPRGPSLHTFSKSKPIATRYQHCAQA
jgi:hypothetical protein